MAAASTDPGSAPMSVADLPDSVLLLSVIPCLDTLSLLRLRATSRRFRALVDDESVWRRKTIAEFNFPQATTARAHTSNSWRLLYIGLARSQVFLWGVCKDRWQSGAESRLAFPNLYGGPEIRTINYELGYSVPIPLRLDVKHEGSVDVLQGEDHRGQVADAEELQHLGVPVALAAGGFGFAALTSSGQVLGWGRLGNLDRNFERPTVLDTRIGSSRVVSTRAKAIGTGREFLVAHLEGENGSVLQWRTWSKPVWVRDAAGVQSRPHLEKLLGDVPSKDVNFYPKIVQVEAGWDFVVTLVSVQVKGPDAPPREIERQLWFWRPSWHPLDWNDATEKGSASASMGACQLPPLPDLHASVSTTLGAEPEVVTQVSAGAKFVVALTSAGRLFQLIVDGLEQETSAHPGRAVDREWSRLDHWDDMGQVEGALAVHPGVSERVGKVSQAQITHISAHMDSFAAYSVPAVRSNKQSLGLHEALLPGQEASEPDEDHKGFVLLSNRSTTVPREPKVVPELQGKGVIKIAFGDWHCGALTDAGRVFSWGGWQDGALGVYDSFPLIEDDDQPIEDQLRSIHERIGVETDSNPSRGILQRIRRPGRFAPTAPGGSAWVMSRAPGVGTSCLPQEQRDELLRFLLRRLRPRTVEQQVATPTRVYFDDNLDRSTSLPLSPSNVGSFAFDIAMGGWHSGALVLDPPREDALLAASSGAAETVPLSRTPLDPVDSAESITSSSSTSSASSPSSQLAQHTPLFQDHPIPRELTADEMGQTGVRVFWFSLVAGAVLVIGLLDGWAIAINWALGLDSRTESSGPSWLNLAYFVPVAIPLALYLIIARWTGDQFFLHA